MLNRPTERRTDRLTDRASVRPLASVEDVGVVDDAHAASSPTSLRRSPPTDAGAVV